MRWETCIKILPLLCQITCRYCHKLSSVIMISALLFVRLEWGLKFSLYNYKCTGFGKKCRFSNPVFPVWTGWRDWKNAIHEILPFNLQERNFKSKNMYKFENCGKKMACFTREIGSNMETWKNLLDLASGWDPHVQTAHHTKRDVKCISLYWNVLYFAP